jgi:Zn-dependent M28 family amino/carboxypeptidase
MTAMRMPGRSYNGPLPPLTAQEREVRQRLATHVWTLAEAIGERNLWQYQALEAAARYVEMTWRDSGYAVTSQAFEAAGKRVRNLVAELVGTNRSAAILVIGAHYDSVQGSPGANDNASGVAAVLEIAHLLAAQRFERTIRFVAFVNEEPPFFQTAHMGSLVYARAAHARAEQLVGMMSLETLGYYTDDADSQQYPFPFGLFYPRVGNFIGFVGNLASRRLVQRSLGSFRRHTAFPSEGTAAPGWLTGIGWSDHWAFWQQGYAALMVTDTALFRYAPYHTAADTPDKLDYDRTARVVSGLARVVSELAGPMTRE